MNLQDIQNLAQEMNDKRSLIKQYLQGADHITYSDYKQAAEIYLENNKKIEEFIKLLEDLHGLASSINEVYRIEHMNSITKDTHIWYHNSSDLAKKAIYKYDRHFGVRIKTFGDLAKIDMSKIGQVKGIGAASIKALKYEARKVGINL